MKEITLQISDLSSIDEIARQFIEATQEYSVFTFEGEMGSGKTTFINALSHALGVTDDATGSPTFAIVNEYRSDTTAELIYHFDLYRLESTDEALDMGFDDYLEAGALCLIEWPEIVDCMLPDDTVRTHITVNADGSRSLRVEIPE